MLSYQHAYHAGGPADVHKHVAFCLLLDHLAKKDKSFAVVDLYAGEGEYDLGQFAARKTEEYRAGVAKVWEAKGAPPAAQSYLDALGHMNPGGVLQRYPGSPALARGYMRDNDRLILNELHSTTFPNLGRWARKDARIAVHKRDGLEALLGLVPPVPRRGVVLIDPSYEVKTEYAAVADRLGEAVKKWREGIFLVWYPILKEARHRALVDGLAAQIDADIFLDEIAFAGVKRGDNVGGLLGTGVVAVNPPWRYDDSMRDAGRWLTRVLGGTKHTATWLKRQS